VLFACIYELNVFKETTPVQFHNTSAVRLHIRTEPQENLMLFCTQFLGLWCFNTDFSFTELIRASVSLSFEYDFWLLIFRNISSCILYLIHMRVHIRYISSISFSFPLYMGLCVTPHNLHLPTPEYCEPFHD
jgi:hypothetical protein